jgi:hypothetical protein
MFGGKAPLRLAAQKSRPHTPSATMRSAPAKISTQGQSKKLVKSPQANPKLNPWVFLHTHTHTQIVFQLMENLFFRILLYGGRLYIRWADIWCFF